MKKYTVQNYSPRGFSGPLLIQDIGVDPVDGIHYYVTLRELSYRLGGNDIVVPAGTETDLATVPWCLQWLIPKMGRYNPAVVLHDWLCRNSDYSRFIGDALFREAMADLGVPLWRRVLMYYGVRTYAVLTGKK